jgi:hypothetical protein
VSILNRSKLKVGILLDSYNIPAWAFASLERVVNLDCVELSVILLNDKTNHQKYTPDLFYSSRYPMAYRLISKIDKAIFGRGPDAFAPENVRELFADIPELMVKTGSPSELGCLSAADIAKIMGFHLDILIRMGFDSLNGEILTAAKYGVWSYYHGDPREIRSNPPGFWEVIDKIPETGSILYIVSKEAKIGKVLYRSWNQTFLFSPARNRNRCFWASSPFLSRQIELLYKLGEIDFFASIDKYNDGSENHIPIRYDMPSNVKALWLFGKLLIRNIQEVIQRITRLDHWRLLYDLNGDQRLLFQTYRGICPPRDRFWADPHLVETNNKYYIFIEEYIYKKKKGNISVIEMDPSGAYKKPIPILSKDYHLSYPFVFFAEDKYYMIPETSENRTIELYECVKFPFEWMHKLNLMENITAVDTTLLYDKGMWWLFTGKVEKEGAFPEVELFLFYSNELISNHWISHPLNPVVSDVKNARSAGRIFKNNGKIYRPSQDCSKYYGWGINLNEISILSDMNYLESTILKIRPEWDKNIVAVHTFSQLGPLTVIDADRRSRRIFNIEK